ncbi:MAG: hypothetical protein EA425_14565 [Puniceicoccaceae bacterium]|nr:MAG: hypothetical protein EA425_14565 [Puniceicoccaceae bacterium]
MRILGRYRRLLAAALLPLLATAVAASPERIVLNAPGFPVVKATSLDQPRLDVFLTDPTEGSGEPISAWNEFFEETLPIVFPAFIDTGASGIVISRILAEGLLDVPSLGIGPDDVLGVFTEIGIGGTELGEVSRPYGVSVINGESISRSFYTGETSAGRPWGEHSLWVRGEVGFGEVIDILFFSLANPICVVGMPVISQGQLVLDPTPLADLEPMRTFLLHKDEPIPATNLAIDLYLNDFVGEEPPPGEVFPSHNRNPMIPGVTVNHRGADGIQRTTTGDWLFDTGAGSSFVSFAQAQAAGLIPAAFEDIDAFMAQYDGPDVEIGGLGDPLVVPILRADEIVVNARGNRQMVWQNVDLMVVDAAGLEGIFGMNLLLPAATIDRETLANLGEGLEALFLLLALITEEASPGLFSDIVYRNLDDTSAELLLNFPSLQLPGGFAAWIGQFFADPSVPQAAPGADPNRNGVPNLLEYALGGHPLEPGNSSAPALSHDASGGPVFTYFRPAGRDEIFYHVEGSLDLETWQAADDLGFAVSEAPADGGTQITWGWPGNGSGSPPAPVFFRLRVSLDPL